ncbi:MAG: HXXEE domain-containing protein [Ignavibacteriales bacterium]|nr:HXXEE domain-containing protein [Ignavibacteriales bacterium]
MAENPKFARAALLAPAILAVHVLEEAPGFVEWFNSLVARGISQPLFLSVNAVAFIITLVLAVMVVVTRERFATILMISWLGFLMMANAVFHIVATVVHARYCPGVLTAALFYLPYFSWFVWVAVRKLRVRVPEALASAFAGSVPMALHGYLIIFRGDRLF